VHDVRVTERPELPPGYPADFERTIRLRDGRIVWVRPILPSDAPELAEAFRAADPDTLHRRFLGAPPHPTERLLTWLTTVDYARRFALVAGDPVSGKGIAIARYEPVSEGVAEVAVVVDPAWRRVGLASALVRLLGEAALHREVHSFTAAYLAENRPVEALLAHADGGRHLIKQGIAELDVNLDRERTAGGAR
jgi:RimJ/RimL family protein N-acetyltransferase